MKDKRINKLNQHYCVWINNKKFIVLNHSFLHAPCLRLRFATKIKGQNFPEGVVPIILTHDSTSVVYIGKWLTQYGGSGIEYCVYEIIENKSSAK